MPKKHSNKKNKDKKPQRPYVGDYGVAIESGPTKVGASFGMIVLSVLVGFLVGFIAWGAYRLALALTDFVWNGVTPTIAQVLGTADVSSWWLPVVVCGFGGLVIGLWSRFVGGVPESLEVVMGSIKQTGEYCIKGFGRSIVGFFLPLMFGGSIGPEAGVTGIIASATCWIGRTLRKAGLRVKEIADVTVSAALSAIFITPLLGIVAVVQDALPKQDWELRDESSARDVTSSGNPNPLSYDFRLWAKIVLYVAAAFGAVAGALLIGSLFGSESGIPRFSGEHLSWGSFWVLIPCVLLGYVGALMYHAANFTFAHLGRALQKFTVTRALLAGLGLGLVGSLLPYTLFPGEIQAWELMDQWQTMSAIVLIATGLMKCVTTPWCLNMGWMGGHFFPCIFAGLSCGYGVAILAGVDPLCCIAVSTATLVAGIQRKPFLAMALLLLCFPLEVVVWMGLACLIGAALPIPAALLATDASECAATKNAGTNNFEVVSASDCTDASDYADRSGVVCSPASVDNTKANPQDQ